MTDTVHPSEEKAKFNSEEIDIWMLRDNLKLSFEERVHQHQKTLDCIDELKEIGRAHYARTSQISHQESD